MFILTSQIKRAADSITSKYRRRFSFGNTNPEFKRFLQYATRSAVEVACLFIGKSRNKL
ncbi:MAG: four helix bundle protein [Bacteroidetes bacterium]|nr:four helix bundle protein [Bacteroidota bacterium]